jgi:hypothetical protein
MPFPHITLRRRLIARAPPDSGIMCKTNWFMYKRFGNTRFPHDSSQSDDNESQKSGLNSAIWKADPRPDRTLACTIEKNPCFGDRGFVGEGAGSVGESPSATPSCPDKNPAPYPAPLYQFCLTPFFAEAIIPKNAVILPEQSGVFRRESMRYPVATLQSSPPGPTCHRQSPEVRGGVAGRGVSFRCRQSISILI